MKLKFLIRTAFSREQEHSRIPLVYTPPMWDENNPSERIMRDHMILITNLPRDLGYWSIYKLKRL